MKLRLQPLSWWLPNSELLPTPKLNRTSITSSVESCLFQFIFKNKHKFQTSKKCYQSNSAYDKIYASKTRYIIIMWLFQSICRTLKLLVFQIGSSSNKTKASLEETKMRSILCVTQQLLLDGWTDLHETLGVYITRLGLLHEVLFHFRSEPRNRKCGCFRKPEVGTGSWKYSRWKENKILGQKY